MCRSDTGGGGHGFEPTLLSGLFETCASTSSTTPAALAAARSGVLAGATSMMPSAEQAAYRARRVLPSINLALILLNNDANSEGPKMRKLLVGLLITGSLCLTFTPRTAAAGSGEVAAGIVGGLAVGTLFGAAVASGPRYYQPAPVYVAPAPVYMAPPCYWTRGAPVWDGYRGIWYRPRIQVCD